MDWMFGLSSNEIEMTALGFAVQTGFFNEIFKSQGFLSDLTLGCGLVGFSVILLTIGRLPFIQVFAWCVLFLIVAIRPIGEPIFFTFLDKNNAPQLYQTPCQGGSLTQEECHRITGNIEGRPVYQERISDRGFPTITAYSPQLAAVSILNRINAGLANQFLSPGQRMLDGYQPAIESIKRGRTQSDSTNYHISQFLEVCATGKEGAAQRLAAAYVPYSQLEKQGAKDVISALKSRKIKAWDAWKLLLHYNGYVQTKTGTSEEALLLPPLVCPASGCNGKGRWDNDPRYDPEISKTLKPITANAADDFIRVRNARRIAKFDVKSLIPRTENAEGLETRMKEQRVSLAMPLNANAIAASMSFETAEDGADRGTDVGPVVNAVGTTLGAGGGCAAGALAGGAAGSIVPFLGNAAGAVLGCVGGAIVGGTVAHAVLPQAYEVSIPLIDGSGSAWSQQKPEKIYVVESCADFHRITDARLFVDTALATRLTDTLKNVLKDGKLPADFGQMNAQDQVNVALHAAIEARKARCNPDLLFDGFSVSDASMPSQCHHEADKDIGELIVAAQTFAVNNTLPGILANAQIEAGARPEMIGELRNVMVGVGDVFAPIGVDIKAIWGGFEAGTYAKIMPFLVSFGTALTIMITPFLYIIGLLVPMWALSILLIPIVGVVYFQLVKVVFTMINIMGNSMIDANELGLLTGSHAKFSDIIMGTAYTMAFILSAGLLFALRNPGAIIQNVAGKADGLSQISWQETVAAAYLGQKVVGMAGQAASGKSWGTLAGQIQNQAAGRGGFTDQFKAAEFETTRQADDMRLTAGQARLTPQESNQQLQQRAQARAMEEINKRADEADKGSGMPGELRRGRRFAFREGKNQRFVDLDSAPISLADAAGKTAPEVAHNREIARKMLSQQVAVIVQHSDGFRYFQINKAKLANVQDAAIHQFVHKLKTQGKIGTLDDPSANQVFDDVILGVKM